MKAGESTLRELLEGRRQFRIPVFQRTFAWKKKNRRQLWDDIVALHYQREGGEQNAQHFIASVVVQKHDFGAHRAESLVVIDGQQRLTTTSALLAALRDIARGRGNEALAQEIDDEFLINRHARDEADRPKLSPSPLDRDEWLAILDATSSPERRSPELRKTYREFRGWIEAGDLVAEEQFDLDELAATVVSGLSVVLITLARDDNVYRIFESLNFKGLPLAQIDLIRNLFMMRLPTTEAERAYTEQWQPLERLLGPRLQPFAHDYYLRSGSFLREDAMYVHAKTILDELQTDDQVRGELGAMGWYAEVWRLLDGGDTDDSFDADIRAELRWLNRFGAQTPWPFLLMVLGSYRATNQPDTAPREPGLRTVTKAEVVGVVRLVESFLVRRMLADIPTNALNRLFIALWGQLDSETDLVSATREQLATRRFPTDADIEKAVRSYPLYTDSRPGQARLVLDRLALDVQGRERVDLEDRTISIEHIVPQTLTNAWREMLGPDAEALHKAWLHTLPNLTLTGYNPELSNNPWRDPEHDDANHAKRPRYRESNIVMTKRLADHDAFGEAELEQRARELAAAATRIWPGPA
jgi:hypothetical protein